MLFAGPTNLRRLRPASPSSRPSSTSRKTGPSVWRGSSHWRLHTREILAMANEDGQNIEWGAMSEKDKQLARACGFSEPAVQTENREKFPNNQNKPFGERKAAKPIMVPVIGQERIVYEAPKRRQRGRGETLWHNCSVKLVQRLRIEDWHPTPLNKLMGCHWGTASKRKNSDYLVIKEAALRWEMRRSSAYRKVKLTIYLRPRQRACDPDAYLKSLLDALVNAALIVDDSRTHGSLEPVEFVRSDRMATEIELTDV